MSDRNPYEVGTHTYKRIDGRGREEEWSWEISPEAVLALHNYHRQRLTNDNK